MLGHLVSVETKHQQVKISARNKAAIDVMVWEGLNRKDAATKAGLKDHALYVALTKPHVKAYYMQQLDVLRTSERARNLHRLAEIRDAGNNMPAVQAIGMLERISEESQGRALASVASPGLTIQIINAGAIPTIDAQLTQHSDKPLITQQLQTPD